MESYPQTQAGNRYVVVVTDMMSRWVEAKAVHKADTDTIIRYLEEELFPRWGYPEAVSYTHLDVYKRQKVYYKF